MRYVRFLLLLPLLLFLGCSDSDEILMVKSGSLEACPSSTVEEAVNSFMGSPSWDSGVADDGRHFVNISGDITLHGKPVRAVIQFIVNTAEGTFDYNAFEINEVPQNNLMALGLISKMCESAN